MNCFNWQWGNLSANEVANDIVFSTDYVLKLYNS